MNERADTIETRGDPNRQFAMPQTAQRVVISINPKAGRSAAAPHVEKLAAQVAAEGMQPEVIPNLQELAERAGELQTAGELRGVVASGGDGTVAELANRLPQQAPLAVFPLGTENLLGRHLGYRRADVSAVCQTLVDGQGWHLDAGEVTWLDGSAPPRKFLLMLSCGFDADVVHRLHKARQSHITQLSYVTPLFSALRNYEYPLLHVTALPNEQAAAPSPNAQTLIPLPALSWLFVFNLPSYAGGLQIAPQAVATDGQFDWCAFEHGGAYHFAKYSLATLLRRQTSLKDFATGHVRGFRLESDRAVPLQIDGDAGGFTPIEVRVLPAGFALLTPRSWQPGGPASG